GRPAHPSVHLLRPQRCSARMDVSYRRAGAQRPLSFLRLCLRFRRVEWELEVTGYLPVSPLFLPLMTGILMASVTVGLALTRQFLRGGRVAAWAVLVVSVFMAERLTREEPGGLRMLAICAALFIGFKSVVGTEDLACGGLPLTPKRWLGFVLTWPGMN